MPYIQPQIQLTPHKPARPAQQKAQTVYLAAIPHPHRSGAGLFVCIALQNRTNGTLEFQRARLDTDSHASGAAASNKAVQWCLNFVSAATILFSLPNPPDLDLGSYPNLTLKHVQRNQNPAFERLQAELRTLPTQ